MTAESLFVVIFLVAMSMGAVIGYTFGVNDGCAALEALHE